MDKVLVPLHAVAVLLFIVVTGCRDSKKAAPSPGVSPTPSTKAQVIQPAATPTPNAAPALLGADGPIAVTPPASFSPEQLVQGRPITFLVSGGADQFLRVKVNAGRGNDPTGSVSFQLAGDEPAISPQALQKGGDCSGNFVYQLPKTATYQVDLHPSGRPVGMDFSLLAANDPMVDPGIQLNQIFISPGSIAEWRKLQLEPFGQWEGCIGDWGPSRWIWSNDHFTLMVMQVAGYKKAMETRSHKDESMEHLEAALERRGKDADAHELPYPANDDAGLNFATRPQFMEWEGWRGLRWIATYGQDTGCWFDDSAYVFQGISNDGRFFVFVRADTANHKLAAKLAQDCQTMTEGRPSEDESAFLKAGSAMLDRAVSSANPSSFQPNVDQLDAVVRSLKIKQ